MLNWMCIVQTLVPAETHLKLESRLQIKASSQRQHPDLKLKINYIKLKKIILNLGKQDNVHVNTSLAYSEVRITEISEQLSRVDQRS